MTAFLHTQTHLMPPLQKVMGGFLCGAKCKAQAEQYRADAEARRIEAESAAKLAQAEIKFREAEKLRFEQMTEFEKIMQAQSIELQKLTSSAQADSIQNAGVKSKNNMTVIAGILVAILVLALIAIKRKG